jgi:hypothetical protein
MHRTGVDTKAAALFEDGITQDELIRKRGRLLPAIAIHEPDGGVHGWFVPIVVGEKLVAFMQFNKAEEFERFSSFMHAPGDMTACPDKASWVDPRAIQKVAKTRLLPGQHVAEPFLTYDRHPDRLVWAVPLSSNKGRQGYIYVAGNYVFTST